MTTPTAVAPTLDEIHSTASLIAPHIIRTPLLRLNVDDSENEIYLKLENLQAIGAFKARTMASVMLTAGESALRSGVYTASSGNAGIGMAWMARQMGIAAAVYVPSGGPTAKLEAIRKFGATVHLLSDDEWWHIIVNGSHPADPGLYIDAVRSTAAMAGNGTIGLEIIEQLPDVDTVIVPFGGGGVACGIASALRELRPETHIVVAESEAATPLTAALTEGGPTPVNMSSSFISGAGAPIVLSEMWPLVSKLIDRTIVVPVSEVKDAIRLMLQQNRIVAEGAGAISVAAALSGNGPAGKTVCVVTGGNIDHSILCKIFSQQPV